MAQAQALREHDNFTYLGLCKRGVYARSLGIAPHTIATYDEDVDHTGNVELSRVDIRLYGHIIASLYNTGSIALHTRGYETALTVSRLSAVLAASKYPYTVALRNRVIVLRTPDGARHPIAAQHGVLIEPDGAVYAVRGDDAPLYTPATA